jgi:hypothetical protein
LAGCCNVLRFTDASWVLGTCDKPALYRLLEALEHKCHGEHGVGISLDPADWGQHYNTDPFQEANHWQTQGMPLFFQMQINIGHSVEVLSLPNNPSDLTRFFEGLAAHGFHIWLSEDESRRID